MKAKSIFLLIIIFMSLPIVSQGQASDNSKPAVAVGAGIASFYRSSEILTNDGEFYKVMIGMVFTGEIQIPTKFSKNIKYIAGGLYNAPHDQYVRNNSFSNQENVSIEGGGAFVGLVGSVPFSNGDFKIGLFVQADIGYYNYNYHFTPNTTPDVSLSSIGTSMKGGLLAQYKNVSIQPFGCFQSIGSEKSGKSLIGSYFGLKIGFEIK